MTPALFNPNAEDAFELFIGTAIGRAEDLYYIDGETAFRARYGEIETFDSELLDMGGQR
ncbi:MAG TPA: hypothetical protein GYA10_00160 [Alphaproteobacteria bacterium]|jgi:hypothetical protein|nr:hypothetical protein [Alphaproteobacteria bacterium]